MKVSLICLALALVSTSCSFRERTGDPQLDGNSVMDMLREAQGNGMTLAENDIDIIDDPNSTVYFADAPSPLGKIRNILAFNDLGFLGLSDGIGSVSQARVFFIDNPTFATRNLLIVGIMMVGESSYTYYPFEGSGKFENGEFTATLMGSSNDMVVRSYDVSGDRFNPSIQLRVESTDGGVYGKFSILAGYH